MTISYDDVVAADEAAGQVDRETVEKWVEIANAGFPDARFAHPRTGVIRPGHPHRGRVLYVLHMLNLPLPDLRAPHVRRRMTLRGVTKPGGKAPHVWDSTPHGRELKKFVRN